MKETLITILRDKNTTRFDFRDATEKLAYILANETSQYLEKESKKLQTPLGEATGSYFKNKCMFVPILRSGIVLLEPFLKYFREAMVGFVGLKRDEKTAIPNLYYKNIPKIAADDNVVVLDPMIATGGSAIEALKILVEDGIQEDKIIFVAVIGSEEGVANIKKNFPNIKIIIVQVDPSLNAHKFIVPGLGDFGDRYFGTE